MGVGPIRSEGWEPLGGLVVVTGDPVDGGASRSRDESDAAAQGWVEGQDGSRDAGLFVLAGTALGVSDLKAGTLPEWFDLRDVASLDALGDPADGVQPVEIDLGGGRTVRYGWTEEFTSRVVDALVATIDRGGDAPAEPAPAEPAAVPSAAVPSAPVATPAGAAPVVRPANAGPVVPPPAAAAPDSPGPPTEPVSGAPETPQDAPEEVNATALVLEDVTYLGGYPGQDKKRKGCTVTLTREVLELSGPKGIAFRVTWDVVRTLEAQNADVARFRMNTKIHRDATALVLECDQDMTLLLEARDCPTIPLRGAITQLIDDLPVVIV